MNLGDCYRYDTCF